ncbi:MAG TPA: carboxypeptidase regulatory-like domain-containing protein [Bacteroidia bacterium]|nr:carboxypeptidase regulatory-like domain-containing protein [Bacteroidia bacterium]
MKSLLTLLFIFHATAGLYANATSIHGTVTDMENKPVEFAVVTLLSAVDSSLVKGAITAADGTYILEDFAPGNFNLVVSLTGYKKKELPVSVNDNQQLEFPAIVLESSEQLDEVMILSAQPLFVQKPGMLVMNVETAR